MNVKSKGPVVDPGICRCCGLMKKCRLLNITYDYWGKQELYSDMIQECFGVKLSHMDGDEKNKLVCANCVVRLREASAFRTQVLDCEKAFLSRINKEDKTYCFLEKEDKLEEYSVTDNNDDISNEDLKNREEGDEPQQNIENVRIIAPRKTMKKKVTKCFKIKTDMKSGLLKTNSLHNKKIWAVPNQPRMRMIVKPMQTTRQKARASCNAISKEKMLHHNILTTVENSYVCPFKNRIGNYYCYYCREIFTDCNELRAHTLTHDPKTFADVKEMKKIIRIDVRKIDCRLCTEKIDNLTTLKTHLRTVHNKTIYSLSDGAIEFLTFNLSMNEHNCLECGQKFPYIDKLIEHLTDHFGKCVCEICGACYIEESSLYEHIRGHKAVAATFPCDHCGKILKSNHSRKIHLANVHEKTPLYTCYKCETRFMTPMQRNRHLIKVHGDSRKFPCKYCSKVFDVRHALGTHIRRCHLKESYKHQCDVCQQKFYSPSILKKHQATHD